MPFHIYFSIIHNSQGTETTQMSINVWMDKKMWNTYTMKNNIQLWEMNMDGAEHIILISQRKTDTVWYHLYGEPKKVKPVKNRE